MKIKKQLVILIIMLLALMLLPTISRAGIESKPGATAVWTKISISDAYKVCYDLRGAASTLGANSLDPHLSLNKDWGAVAYLGLSSYGSVRNANGTQVSADGRKYNSTTKNITGVMDFGKNKTYTSSIIAETTNDEIDLEYRENLTNALKNSATSKYVESLDKTANTDVKKSKGMALAETSRWYSSRNNWYESYPCFVRNGVCGFENGDIGNDDIYGYSYGCASPAATFRPAIWN